jgi:hypothetical protein
MPSWLLNNLLLSFPQFYHTSWVNYESNLPRPALEDLQQSLRRATRLPGDVIECGSSRCGTSILMARWLRQWGVTKTIYACDSFTGFDRAELRRERTAGWSHEADDAYTSTSYAYVSRKVRVLGYANMVRPVQGYLQQTLPGLAGPFCFALVDCDLRDSMLFAARCLFDKLVPGGWIAFDDYACEALKGARLAVDEFVREYASHLATVGLRRHLYLVRKWPSRPTQPESAVKSRFTVRWNRLGLAGGSNISF